MMIISYLLLHTLSVRVVLLNFKLLTFLLTPTVHCLGRLGICMWLIVSILRYLVESLQKCYLLSKQVPKNLDNYSKETTPFNQIFGGYMRQVIWGFIL